MLYFLIGVIIGVILAIGISCIIVSGRCSERERQAEWRALCKNLTTSPNDPPDSAESVEDFYGKGL